MAKKSLKEKLIAEFTQSIKIIDSDELSPSEKAGEILDGKSSLPEDYLCDFGYWLEVKDLVTEALHVKTPEEVAKEEEEIRERAQKNLARLDKIAKRLKTTTGTSTNES